MTQDILTEARDLLKNVVSEVSSALYDKCGEEEVDVTQEVNCWLAEWDIEAAIRHATARIVASRVEELMERISKMRASRDTNLTIAFRRRIREVAENALGIVPPRSF